MDLTEGITILLSSPYFDHSLLCWIIYLYKIYSKVRGLCFALVVDIAPVCMHCFGKFPRSVYYSKGLLMVFGVGTDGVNGVRPFLFRVYF